MKFRSIRARLTLWTMGILTLIFLVMGGAAYGFLSYSLIQEVDNSLKGVAGVLAKRNLATGRSLFSSDVEEIFRRFFGFSPWRPYFQMLDPRERGAQPGRPQDSRSVEISKEALENARKGLPTYETVKGSEPYPLRLLTAPVMKRGTTVNIIRVGTSLENVFRTKTRFLIVMAGLLPVGLLLSWAGGWLLSRRALQPVDRMAEAARHISAEHLQERVEGTGAGDELDRLALTLNQMLTRLDEGVSRIRRFTADASHELQTPITSLRGEIEVALRSPRSPEEYRETLKSALEEIEHITGLVDGLLILARADSGMLKMDSREVDLGELVEEVYWRMKVFAEERSVTLEAGPPGNVPFRGDRERIRRLLVNLVDNAVKYTEPGGRVFLSLEAGENQVKLTVSDTGRGIPPAEQDSIFQPFYRSEEVVAERGSGLGLSISKSIAEAHGGRILVESSPGTGSTFQVILPTPF